MDAREILHHHHQKDARKPTMGVPPPSTGDFHFATIHRYPSGSHMFPSFWGVPKVFLWFSYDVQRFFFMFPIFSRIFLYFPYIFPYFPIFSYIFPIVSYSFLWFSYDLPIFSKAQTRQTAASFMHLAIHHGRHGHCLRLWGLRQTWETGEEENTGNGHGYPLVN